ncbi:MAG: SGNH/GDSL hydrolase family protein, partial [Kiritimatiellae bacterium]|nr:SGNH/GDSL hydrolase family protein [Kiritimatiellia bacterium]
MLSMILFAAFVADVPVKTESPLKFYPSYAEVQDSAPGKTVALKSLKIRKPGRFWMFVESPRMIEFTLRREVDAGCKLDKTTPHMQFNFIQVECAGQHRRRWPAPGEKDFTFKWDSPHPGFYTLDFDPGKACSLVPVSANVPFALETEDGFEQLAQGKGWKVNNRPLKELDEAASKVKLEKPVNILYLGDSLSDFDRGSNHVDTVVEYLAKHNPGKVKCWNFAKGGDCIRYIIQRMDGKGKGDWKARYDDLWNRKYDWAFVLLGHNDTKTNLKNDFKEPFTPRSQQHEMYDELIRRLRAKGVKRIVLLSSTSSNFDVCNHWVTSRLEKAKASGKGISLFGQPEQMEAFNKALKEIAARNKVEYADIYDSMKARADKPSMLRFTDGVHLSKKGYDFVALETLRYLAANPAPKSADAVPEAKTPAPMEKNEKRKIDPVALPDEAIVNGSFESHGEVPAAKWKLPDGWKIGSGVGRNGGGGLMFETT